MTALSQPHLETLTNFTFLCVAGFEPSNQLNFAQMDFRSPTYLERSRQGRTSRALTLWPLLILLVLTVGTQAALVKSPTPAALPPSPPAPPLVATPPKPAPAPAKTKPPTPAPKAPPPKAAAPKAPPPKAAAPKALPPKALAPKAPPPKALVPAPVGKAPAKAPSIAPGPVVSPAKAPSPSGSAASPAPAVAAGVPLDAAQVKALNALGITTGANACSTVAPAVLQCDGNTTTRHVSVLSAQNCPATATLTEASLLALSTHMTELSFVDCSLQQLPQPTPEMQSVLTAFSVTGAPTLYGWWMGQLLNLHNLTVMDVAVNASGVAVITNNLKNLQELWLSNASLPGSLPPTWPTKLTSIDLSNNQLTGSIPIGLSKLSKLQRLDLSGNQLNDHIISGLGDLTALQSLSLANNQLHGKIPATLQSLHYLTHLDLSSNQLNGTIPQELNNLQLTYLDLRNNSLSGPIPFDDNSIRRLTTFELAGNPGLCYLSNTTTAKAAKGLPICGGSIAPAPGPSNNNGPAPTPTPVSSPQAGASPSKKKKLNVVVIVFATLGALAALAAIIYCCCRFWGRKAGYT